MTKPTCSVEGCTRPVKGRGLCNKHYLRWYLHGSVELPKRPPRPVLVCAVDACDRTDVVGRGLCNMHYRRWRASGTVELRPRERSVCSVDGCDKPHEARGLCQMHYLRMKKHGDPLIVLSTAFPVGNDYGSRVKNPGRAQLGRTGEISVNWKGDDIGYSAMHVRVSKVNGKASGHTCQHCGAPARDWCYDHADPNEKTSTEPRALGFKYSTNPAHYIPLCISCHRRFDL